MHALPHKNLWTGLLLGLFILSGCQQQPQPQEPDPVRRKSPIAIAKLNHDPTDTYLKVVYGQPYKRDRQIFGKLVPYNKVWRTGANEATEMTVTQDIRFGDQKLEAGTYALFTIPRKDEDWTIILNSELGQWGAFDYRKGKDVMRIQVPATQQKAVTEAFTIQFSEVHNDSTNIVLRWDQQEVKVPIEFIAPASEQSS